jgi:hypothetical protein
LDYVDQLEKHARDCQITQGYNGGIADHQKMYTQILGTVKFWKKKASLALNKQLTMLVRRSGNISLLSHANPDMKKIRFCSER